MKPTISYGIVGGRYASDWEILSITSEKAGRRGMVYGRDEHDAATHHKPADVYGRFPTLEVAKIAQAALRQIHRDHAPAIEQAALVYQQLQTARNDAIGKALDNITVSLVA